MSIFYFRISLLLFKVNIQKIIISIRYTIFQVKFSFLSKLIEFTGGAVEFGGIKKDIPLKACDFFNQKGQFFNGDILSYANIDQPCFIVVLH
jgi:hypothetical protein